jgi:hypothetical protein
LAQLVASGGSSGLLESRISIPLGAGATSTHIPLFRLRLAFSHTGISSTQFPLPVLFVALIQVFTKSVSHTP